MLHQNSTLRTTPNASVLALSHKVGLKVTQRSMAGRGTTFEITASPLEFYRAADQPLRKLNPAAYGQPFVNRKKVRFG